MTDSLSKQGGPDWQPSELTPQLAQHLRSLTPARIALKRSGISTATSEVLGFQLAHARARDAVHAALQPASLSAELSSLAPASSTSPILLHSAAVDRRLYLQRPDLGRKLDQPSRERLQGAGAEPSRDLAIVLADGLSALAVERHAVPLLREFFLLLPSSPAFRLEQNQSYDTQRRKGQTAFFAKKNATARVQPGYTSSAFALAPICIVEQARVAIGDEIARLLRAEMVIVLIGERPGLSSPDSLGAYITWNPHPNTTDAERNCISNIRPEGLHYAAAARRLLYYMHEGRRMQQTGVGLKDPDALPTPVLEADRGSQQ